MRLSAPTIASDEEKSSAAKIFSGSMTELDDLNLAIAVVKLMSLTRKPEDF